MKQKRRPRAGLIAAGVFLILAAGAARLSHDVNMHEQRNRMLVDAVVRGDADEVSTLLKEGADANTRWVPANQPSGKMDLWHLILHWSVRPPSTPNLPTVLILACEGGDHDTIQLLLDHGAQVNLRGGGRNSIGSNPGGNGANGPLTTPLIALLSKGEIYSRSLSHHKWAQQSYEKWMDSIRLLLDHRANINAGDSAGQTPLMRAASMGNIALVRFLLDRGADIRAKDITGDTVLARALTSDNSALVSFLLARGAVLQPQDLVTAARRGNPQLVGMLLKSGANARASAPEGSTPLMGAAEASRPDLVRLFLGRGADVNARDNTGNTALLQALPDRPSFYASPAGQLEVVRLLLSQGARADVRNAAGDSPMIRAAGNYYSLEAYVRQIIQLLASHGAVIDADCLTPAAFMMSKMTQNRLFFLIDTCQDVNVRSKKGEMMLTWAINQGRDDILHKLLTRGADVNLAAADGQTPLMRAILKDRSDLAALLITHGANVNAHSRLGESALMLAAKKNDVDTVRLLLQHGADARAHSTAGWTAAEYANGYPPVLALLQDKDIKK